MAAAHHTVFFELRDALGNPGCAICTLTVRRLNRYFTGLGYERVNDRGLRDRIRAARGFCATHGQRLQENRTALGTAIIQRDVLNTLRGDLTAERSAGRGMMNWLMGAERAATDPLAPQQACPACAERREAEQHYIAALVAHLNDDALYAALEGSAGLCTPHLRDTLRRAPNAPGHERFRQAQSTIWERLIGELDEFIRKHDHQFAHEPAGAENDSWARAVTLVSSHPLLGRRHDE